MEPMHSQIRIGLRKLITIQFLDTYFESDLAR
jgi:hypothetical protein